MKLLIVAPYFPPDSSVAIVRIASLTRYLVRKGYDITILTNKNNKVNRNEIKEEGFANIKKIEVNISLAEKRFFPSRDLYIEKFNEVMSKENYDCVFITSGPFYTLPLVEISKKVYKTKTILDFRDLWVLDIRSYKELFRPKNLIRKLVFFPMEKRAIKYADSVVTVTDGWANLLKKFHFKHKNKIDVVYNGYDEYYLKKFRNTTKHKEIINNQKVNIMSFGKLTYYSEKYSAVFFRGVKSIKEKHQPINIIQIGNEEIETKQIIKMTGFNKENYFSTGFCDYVSGVEYLLKTDVCVLIDIRNQAIGTKIYDYIYADKPILYIGKKDTYLSNFVASFTNGFSCQTPKQVNEALSYIIENNIKKLVSSGSITDYSREPQNKKMEQIMISLIKDG